MSGLFLTVWDDAARDRSPVLRTTSSGYPRITVLHAGKGCRPEELVAYFGTLMYQFLSWHLTATDANIQSCDRDGRTRYDVVLSLDALTRTRIREAHARLPPYLGVTAACIEPGITHSTHWSLADAEAARVAVKRHLPYDQLRVTGLTLE